MPKPQDNTPVDPVVSAEPVVTVKTADGSEVTIPTPGPIKNEHGAQNHLTGDARAAARGALHGDIVSNTIARDAAVSRGEAGDGMTPDGSLPNGSQQPDVKDGTDQAKFGPAADKPSV